MPEKSTTPDLEELTRRVVEAASRRDVDALLGFYSPRATLDSHVGTFEGVDAIRAFLEDWWRGYEDYQISADEIVRLGEGAVLTISTQVARLVGGSESFRLHNGHIFRFEDELVVRVTVYHDIDEARAAAERLAKERG
jgi:hypothetical protein